MHPFLHTPSSSLLSGQNVPHSFPSTPPQGVEPMGIVQEACDVPFWTDSVFCAFLLIKNAWQINCSSSLANNWHEQPHEGKLWVKYSLMADFILVLGMKYVDETLWQPLRLFGSCCSHGPDPCYIGGLTWSCAQFQSTNPWGSKGNLVINLKYVRKLHVTCAPK